MQFCTFIRRELRLTAFFIRCDHRLSTFLVSASKYIFLLRNLRLTTIWHNLRLTTFLIGRNLRLVLFFREAIYAYLAIWILLCTIRVQLFVTFWCKFSPHKISSWWRMGQATCEEKVKNPSLLSFLVSINIWFVLVVVSVIFLIFRINVMAWLHP